MKKNKSELMDEIMEAVEIASGAKIVCLKCAKYFTTSREINNHECSGKPNPLDLIELGRMQERQKHDDSYEFLLKKLGR